MLFLLKERLYMRIVPFLLAFAGALIIFSCADNVRTPLDPDPPDKGNGNGGDSTGVIFLGRPPVFINEVYSANADLKDEFGGDPGWVEFYNPADTAVNLKGYWLTNTAGQKIWEFGNVVVEPHGYLIAFFSGRNRPDADPGQGDMDLIGRAVTAWSWADSQNNPPGGSTASETFTPGSGGLIAGRLVSVDNSAGLGWSSAVVAMEFANWNSSAVIDISGADQIRLRGYVAKDARLEVRLMQRGMDDWLGWPAQILGTGVQDEVYTIALPSVNSEYPDLKNIYGLRFSNPGNFFGSIDFNFNSIITTRRGSSVHVSFQLTNRGGSLFLLDPDGHIRDSVAYPARTLGLSYAKNPDDGTWAYSKPPTPYAANTSSTYIGQVQPPAQAGIPASGYYDGPLTFTLPDAAGGVFIGCDTTGRFPTAESALRSGTTLTVTRNTAMRCAQFMAGAYPSTPIIRTYIVGGRLPSLPVVSIAVDPYEMFDPNEGLYSMGRNASPEFPHRGANFWRETELPMQIEFFEGGVRQAWNSEAGLRIFGNWSRGNAKKSLLITFREIYGQSRLNYSLFPEYPHLTRFKHFILRNNGNNFSQDYIRDMLMTSLTEGLGIDYQKGRAVIVYLNGQYYGIHNMRERANGDYFEANYDIREEFIDLVKASNEVSSGSDADYRDILNWISAGTLSDEDLVTLNQRMDVDNFTYNHICRIYYNDRDWPGNNMKRWRVNSPPSRWKWLMYDTDHGWGSYGIWEQPHLGALAFATRTDGPDWPNPPHTTLILRKLLENAGYKNSFINRFSLIIATYFNPERVEAKIDALMAPIASEIPLDQQRWRHDASAMNRQLSTIRDFGRTRPANMQREIETFFGLGSPIDFTVSAAGNGNVQVDGLQVMGGRATFKAYPEVPITVKAVPGPGAEFLEWSDGVADAERVADAGQVTTLEARFSAASLSRRKKN